MMLPAAFLQVPLAHRGLHDRAAGRPENGRAAIRAAVAAGYGIEIDLQPSADGRAMVFHDDLLDRMTHARGPVRERRAEALGRIALRGGDGIPTLPQVLALVAGRVPLLIELKDQGDDLQGTDGVLEAATAAALDGYDGPVAVMSFNPDMVAAMARLAPTLPRGLTTCGFSRRDWALPEPRRAALRAIADYDRVGACFISHDAADLACPRLDALRQAGAAVLCWTIRSPEEEAAARRRADTITFEGYLPVPAAVAGRAPT